MLFNIINETNYEKSPRTQVYEFYNVGGVSIVQKVCWKTSREDHHNYDCYILKRLFTRRRNFHKGVLRVTSVVCSIAYIKLHKRQHTLKNSLISIRIMFGTNVSHLIKRVIHLLNLKAASQFKSCMKSRMP